MKDLFVRRIYTHKGISVVVELDFVKCQISLVEKNGQCKKWYFNECTIEYMNGWIAIFEAMKYATEQASKEMKKFEDEELANFAILLSKVDKVLEGKKK